MAKANFSILPFCSSTNEECELPLYFGGNISISIEFDSNQIFFSRFYVGNQAFSCSSDLYETRYCHFTDICFNGHDFVVKSEYPIDFANPLLTLEGRTANTGSRLALIEGQLHSNITLPSNIEWVQQKVNVISPYVAVYYFWHTLYDFIVPFAWTITENGLISTDRKIFMWNEASFIPELLVPFSSSKIEYLLQPFCAHDLTLGMKKIIKYNKDKLIEEYSIPPLSTIRMREIILKSYGIDTNGRPRKLAIILLRRNERLLLNPEGTLKAVKKVLPGYTVESVYFEDYETKDVLAVLSQTSVFIGVHGSGLSNVMFLPQNSTFVEIVPFGFTCRDWLGKAAMGAGVRHLMYEADNISETIEDGYAEVKECLAQPDPCYKFECRQTLFNRDIYLNASRFGRALEEFIASQ